MAPDGHSPRINRKALSYKRAAKPAPAVAAIQTNNHSSGSVASLSTRSTKCDLLCRIPGIL